MPDYSDSVSSVSPIITPSITLLLIWPCCIQPVCPFTLCVYACKGVGGQNELNANVMRERTCCVLGWFFRQLPSFLMSPFLFKYLCYFFTVFAEYGGHGEHQSPPPVWSSPTRELQEATDRPVSSLCFLILVIYRSHYEIT